MVPFEGATGTGANSDLPFPASVSASRIRNLPEAEADVSGPPFPQKPPHDLHGLVA